MMSDKAEIIDVLKELLKNKENKELLKDALKDILDEEKETIPKKKSKNKTKPVKPSDPSIEGLKVICTCGNILSSLYTFYINSMDISYWECNGCGSTYSIEMGIEKLGKGDIPEEKKESKRKDVRLKCFDCGNTIYAGSTNYVNKLPRRSRWRCQECGSIYLVIKKMKLNIETELI